MLEYMHPALIYVGLITLFALLIALLVSYKDKDGKTARKVITTFILISIIMPTSQAYYTQQTAQENMQHFKQDKVLQCTSLSSYKVSKEDGWELDKNYFIKDSLMIRADHCKIFKK